MTFHTTTCVFGLARRSRAPGREDKFGACEVATGCGQGADRAPGDVT